jgi:group I intron endonuclease
MFIYKITNITNGKAYIGLTTKSVRSRWKAHISNAFAKNIQYYLYKAMRKYGLDSFKVETLYEAVDLRELIAVEKGLIAQYGTLYNSNGYNQSSGGESRSGVKLSPEVVAQMRIRTMAQLAANGHPMQGRKHSGKSRAQMSVSAKCKPPISDKTRQKLSIAATGRVIPREAVEVGRQKRIGVMRTPEQCVKIAIGRVGKGLGNQASRKYSAQLIKNALEFVLSGSSQTAASKLFGVSSSHLSHLLSGDRQQNWQRRIS